MLTLGCGTKQPEKAKPKYTDEEITAKSADLDKLIATSIDMPFIVAVKLLDDEITTKTSDVNEKYFKKIYILSNWF